MKKTTTTTTTTTGKRFAAFVGLDWADRSHRVCLRPAGSDHEEQRDLAQDPRELHTWVAHLRVRFPRGKIAVALEQSRGPVIYALMRYDHLELFPVNPAMLARYREAASSASGVKDDPFDAHLACELLRCHPDWLRPLSLAPAPLRELQMLCEARRGFVDQRTACGEQLTALLKGYFPQALVLAGKVGSPMAGAFLRRWPSLAAVQRVRAETLRTFYRRHGLRSDEEIAERLEIVRTAVALTDDAAVLAALPVQAQVIVAQLATLHDAMADYDQRIAQVFAQQPEASFFAALPGAGEQLAPRLCVAFGSDRSRYQTAEELQCYSGIAPVKKRSGDSLNLTQWRWHCPQFLRQTFHEFAGNSVQQSRWARAFYLLEIERGKSPQKAKRALAYKWQRVLFRCWQNHESYDEDRYIAALRRRGSPLVAHIDALDTNAA